MCVCHTKGQEFVTSNSPKIEKQGKEPLESGSLSKKKSRGLSMQRFKKWLTSWQFGLLNLIVLICSVTAFLYQRLPIWMSAVEPSPIGAFGIALSSMLLGGHLVAVFYRQGDPYKSHLKQAKTTIRSAYDRLATFLISTAAHRPGYHVRAYMRVPEGITPSNPTYLARSTSLIAKPPWSMTIPEGSDPLWISVTFACYDPDNRKYVAGTAPCVNSLWMDHYSEDGSAWHYQDEYDSVTDRFMRYRHDGGHLSPIVRLDTSVPTDDKWMELAQFGIGISAHIRKTSTHSFTAPIEIMHLDYVRELKAVLELKSDADPAANSDSLMEETFSTMDRCPTLPPSSVSENIQGVQFITFNFSHRFDIGEWNVTCSVAFHRVSDQNNRVVDQMTLLEHISGVAYGRRGTLRIYWR